MAGGASGISTVAATGTRIGTVDIGGTIATLSTVWIIAYQILEASSLITTIVDHESNI